MKPKKVKDLIPKVAERLQLPEKDVKSVLDIYWDKVRKSLSNIDCEYINLPKLGVMYLKPWMVDKKIKVNDAVINRYIENPTVNGLTIINNLSKDNTKLKLAQTRLTELRTIKENIRYERRRLKEDMEGKEEDI